jgi:hypothetical protein
MNNILDQLRSHDSNPGKTSTAIEELYCRIVVPMVLVDESVPIVDTSDMHDEEYLDFFMEDGISTLVSNAIQNDKVSSERISQAFDVLFRVAGDNACHWKEIWEAFGKVDGMILFVDNHVTNKQLFVRALEFCSQLSHFHLLRARAIDIFRWIPFWDLLIEGVETYFEEDDQIFYSFCCLLEGHRDEWIPLELYGRIALLLMRGLEREKCKGRQATTACTVLATSSMVQRIRGRFAMEEMSRGRGTPVNGANSLPMTSSPHMFIPCSAAA